MYVEFEDGQKIHYTIDDVKDSGKAKAEAGNGQQAPDSDGE